MLNGRWADSSPSKCKSDGVDDSYCLKQLDCLSVCHFPSEHTRGAVLENVREEAGSLRMNQERLLGDSGTYP